MFTMNLIRSLSLSMESFFIASAIDPLETRFHIAVTPFVVIPVSTCDEVCDDARGRLLCWRWRPATRKGCQDAALRVGVRSIRNVTKTRYSRDSGWARRKTRREVVNPSATKNFSMAPIGVCKHSFVRPSRKTKLTQGNLRSSATAKNRPRTSSTNTLVRMTMWNNQAKVKRKS